MSEASLIVGLLSVSTVLAILITICSIIGLIYLVKTSERLYKLQTMENKLSGIESAIIALLQNVNYSQSDSELEQPSVVQVWRTPDGRYSASSPQELVRLLAENGELPIDPNDEAAIREAVEKMIGNIEDEPIDEDDDESDEEFEDGLK